jgi:hypothetical protein
MKSLKEYSGAINSSGINHGNNNTEADLDNNEQDVNNNDQVNNNHLIN